MVKKDVSKGKEFPPFKPIAYFGGNLLLAGLSYVLLRQYLRFFIFIGIAIVTNYIPYGDTIFMIILFASAFDAHFISKRLKNKEIPAPKYNNILTWVAILIWLTNISFQIYSFFLI